MRDAAVSLTPDDEAEISRALRLQATDSTVAVAGGFAIGFAVIAVVNWTFQPAPAGRILGSVNGATSITLAAWAWWIRRRPREQRPGDGANVAVALAGVANTALGFAFFDTPLRVIVLSATVIATAVLALRTWPLVVTALASLAAYGFAIALHGPSTDWGIMGLVLTISCAIGAIFQQVRRRAAWRIEAFKLTLARRAEELEKALEAVRAGEAERRVLEQQAEVQREALDRSARLAALGTLVAGVAHEVNNPLAYMSGNAELVRDVLIESAKRADVPLDVRRSLEEAEAQIGSVLSGAERLRVLTKTSLAGRRGRAATRPARSTSMTSVGTPSPSSPRG